MQGQPVTRKICLCGKHMLVRTHKLKLLFKVYSGLIQFYQAKNTFFFYFYLIFRCRCLATAYKTWAKKSKYVVVGSSILFFSVF